MTDCLADETLQRALAGELPPEETATVDAHLQECARCRAVLDRETDHLGLRPWFQTGRLYPAVELDAKILDRMLEPFQTPSPRRDGTNSVAEEGLSSRACGSSEPPACLGTIGSFRLLDELGRGGMGIVYRAWDEPLRRVVALKVVRPDQSGETDRRRLVREAQLASSFRDDHAVTIHAVVDPPDGLPYLVMEYVPGPTLAQLIGSDQRPEPRRVAAYVAQVADALHAAHGAGLIHRDVKPGNILIDDPTGRAKISDFGLARAQGVQSSLTQEGFLAGTPTYMSPEQARGESRLDGRTDVYSLGATLYEALTGATPYRGAPHLVLRQIIEDEPRPLRELNDAVPRDLETICLKAMNREPARRYQTARELADDLRRWLGGEPIHARPTGRLERAWRWCGRNRRVAALAASLVFVFCAGFLGVVWQWRRAESSLKDAQTSFQWARRAVDQFYIRFYEQGVLKVPGLEKVRHEVLGEILQYYKDFLEQHRDDPSLRRELAEACYRIGAASFEFGNKADARTFLRRALPDLAELVRLSPGDHELLDRTILCFDYLGQAQGVLGDDEAARRTYQRGIDLLDPIVRAESGNLPLRARLSLLSGNLANLFAKRGDLPLARKAYLRTLDLHEELVQQAPENVGYQTLLALTYHNLAAITHDRPEEEEALIRKALEIRKQLVEQAPTSTLLRRNLARTYQHLGFIQNATGRMDEGLRSLEQACRLLQQVVVDQPATTQYQADLGHALSTLGSARSAQGRLAEGKAALQQAQTIYQKLLHANPEHAEWRSSLKSLQDDLAADERVAKESRRQAKDTGATGGPDHAPDRRSSSREDCAPK
jgi:tetratricopeptide (TPR) repeat protein